MQWHLIEAEDEVNKLMGLRGRSTELKRLVALKNESVPSILESDATGRVAAIYADIRQVLGTSFVTLVWRNLATMPLLQACSNRRLPPAGTLSNILFHGSLIRTATDGNRSTQIGPKPDQRRSYCE